MSLDLEPEGCPTIHCSDLLEAEDVLLSWSLQHLQERLRGPSPTRWIDYLLRGRRKNIQRVLYFDRSLKLALARLPVAVAPVVIDVDETED